MSKIGNNKIIEQIITIPQKVNSTQYENKDHFKNKTTLFIYCKR